MAIFAEVTENERIIYRHLCTVRYTSTPRLWRFWKSVYDLDLIWFDWNRPISTIWHYGHPKLTHTAARFLCDSWATCYHFWTCAASLYSCCTGVCEVGLRWHAMMITVDCEWCYIAHWCLHFTSEMLSVRLLNDWVIWMRVCVCDANKCLFNEHHTSEVGKLLMHFNQRVTAS